MASTHGCQYYQNDDGYYAWSDCYSPDGNHRPDEPSDGMFLYELRQTIDHHTHFHSCYGYESCDDYGVCTVDEASCNTDPDCYYRDSMCLSSFARGRANLESAGASAVLLQYHLYYKEYDACQENSDQSACNSLDYCSFDDGSGQCWTISNNVCLLYTSPSPRDATLSRMPSSA